MIKDKINDSQASESMEVEQETSDMIIDDRVNKIRDEILDCVANSDGFFKSQQVGEDDLTFSEKREIANTLLSRNIPLFLQRYWKFIKIENLPYFDSHKGNYEVDFYIKEIMKFQNLKTNKVSVKNRRYEALKQMVKEGTYFSDVEMKRRNPFLYDQFIGQHLTEEEKISATKAQTLDDKFSNFLMGQMERNHEKLLYAMQQDADEAIIEEDDDSESDEEIETKTTALTDLEKQMLRNEFTNIMYENFLDGKDDFDYSSVDYNADYDSIDQRDLDEEEKYFDEDSPENLSDS